MKRFLSLLTFASFALADIDYYVFNDNQDFTFTPSSSWGMVADGTPSCAGGKWLLTGGEGSFTFIFPQASTTFKWWGWQFGEGAGGLASICFDGAVGSACQTLNTVNATAADAPVILYATSSLSNAVHSVTISNIPDPSQGGAENFLTVDRISLEGTVGNPVFPEGTTLTTVPMYIYKIPVVLGGHELPLTVILDTGAAGVAWAVWEGCSEDDCAGHNQYHPSNGPDFYNFSTVDAIAFGAGTSFFHSWRVNDTFQFGDVAGNPATPVTFGASFSLDGAEPVDGNFGLAKGFFIAGQCKAYPNFVETAYTNGVISNPVIAFYELNDFDEIAPGLTSVVQLGGVDQNKYIGEIDWIPMTLDSWWVAYDVTRKISTSSGSAPVTIDFNERQVIFDTGDGGLAGIPMDDWYLLVESAGALQTSDGNWWFPCESTMSMDMNGSQGVIYTVPLGDTTNVKSDDNTMCGATMNSMEQGPNWIMGLPFFSNYYTIFHYEANVMGLATKNLGASALTTSVLIGPS